MTIGLELFLAAATTVLFEVPSVAAFTPVIAPASFVSYRSESPQCLSSASFNDIALDYETRVEPVTAAFIDEMLEPFSSGDLLSPSILDLGCGTGAGALRAASIGFSVTAVDSSPAMVGRVSERCELSDVCDQVSCRVADAQSLPAEWTNRFEFCVSAFALIFFLDPLAAAREIHRSLKPGGSVVVAGWGDRGDSPAFRIIPDAVRSVAPDLVSVGRMKKAFLSSSDQVAKVMRDAGFIDVETREGIKRSLVVQTAEEYFERFALASPPTRNMMAWIGENMGEERLDEFKEVLMNLAIERGGGKPEGPIEIVSPAFFVYGVKP